MVLLRYELVNFLDQIGFEVDPAWKFTVFGVSAGALGCGGFWAGGSSVSR